MSLFDAARACLDAADPAEKVALTQRYAAAFARGELPLPEDAPPPDPIRMPGRPPRPRLVHPREVPKRGLGSVEGRAAFVHAIAHIELNAIDLGWDAVYRFRGLPPAFYADWVGVAHDESRHFMLLRTRLQARAQQHEVARLVVGHAHPVGVERRRQAAEAVDCVPAQVDGVEFDMGDGMDEGRAPLHAAQAALGHFARMHQPRSRRAAGHADRIGRRRVLGQRQLAAREGRRVALGQGDLLGRIGGIEAGARSVEQ